MPSKCTTHLRTSYLHFLAWHVHLDARCLACWQMDEQSSRQKKEWKNIDSRRPRRSKEPRGGASALIIFYIIQRYKINQISCLAGSRVFPCFYCLPTYRTTSQWAIPLQTPREAVEMNKSNLFLMGTLTWLWKGVIADYGKIIDYHIGIHEHGAHLQHARRRKERKTKWSAAEGCDQLSHVWWPLE